MSNTPFEKFLVWKKAKLHVVDLYRYFEKCRDYAFKDQLFRAALSIINNIAEGCESKTDKEFARYLGIAKASSGEVRSMLYLGKELGYLDDKKFDTLCANNYEISKMIFGLINKLNKNAMNYH